MKLKQILPALLITFVDSFGFTVMIPVLPFIVDKYGYGDLAYGILLSAYAMSQFIAAPFLGTLSDKYGRKPVLFISQLGTVISWCVFALAWFTPDIPVFGISLPVIIIFISRIFDGATGGNYSVAMAYISDNTSDKDRSKAFAIINATSGLALLLGPAIGSISFGTPINYLGTIIVAGCISIVTLIFISFIEESLPESKRRTTKLWQSSEQLFLKKRIAKLQLSPKILQLFNIKFFFTFVVNAFTTVIILFVIDAFSYNEKQIALLLVLVGIAMVGNQLVLVKRFSSKFGDHKSMVIGLVLMCVGLYFSIFFINIYYMLFCFYVMSIGISLGLTTISSLLTQKASSEKQGEILGIDTSINAFTSGIAPVTASVIYSGVGQYVFIILGLIIMIGPFLLKASKKLFVAIVRK